MKCRECLLRATEEELEDGVCVACLQRLGTLLANRDAAREQAKWIEAIDTVFERDDDREESGYHEPGDWDEGGKWDVYFNLK